MILSDCLLRVAPREVHDWWGAQAGRRLAEVAAGWLGGERPAAAGPPIGQQRVQHQAHLLALHHQVVPVVMEDGLFRLKGQCLEINFPFYGYERVPDPWPYTSKHLWFFH